MDAGHMVQPNLGNCDGAADRGTCPGLRGDGGDHEDVADSPVQRPTRLRPLGRGPPSLSAPRTSHARIRCASQ
jgi:hypothetical protein